MVDHVKKGPLMIMIPLRIGTDRVDDVNIEQVKLYLFSSMCKGVMGGK